MIVDKKMYKCIHQKIRGETYWTDFDPEKEIFDENSMSRKMSSKFFFLLILCKYGTQLINVFFKHNRMVPP